MSGYQTRQTAIAAVTNFKSDLKPLNFTETSPTDVFGSNVFNDKVMKNMLPKDVYKSLMATKKTGEKMDPAIAGPVAAAMKEWAISKGATHYTHVFYPLTGLTAEKHDGFLSPDDEGGAIAEFDAKLLIQGEPDASSFPSGGLRATFEARGYTAWDVTNPAYILENPNGTFLCIPTAFVSWKGHALDKKTPLLRANQAINKAGRRFLDLFGNDDGNMVVSNAGPEQEYFLLDRNFYFARPDLMVCGRTLFGAKPAKGQELDDHYFGAIPRRVLAFMMEVERELYKLGVPVKTRHNEVAPGQFEIAPIFEQANLATDHNQMIMTTLKSVAKKHGMACLLHEKPFAGINGSGKHLNYSLSSATQGSLYSPGDTPHENMQFLCVTAATIRAVEKYSALLRSVVASAGNDHRLGANEAPPAIISIFLGEELAEIFNQIELGDLKGCKSKGCLEVGVDTLPALPMDSGDRNRTSPFAFTGNRFEFRAVGSNQSIAGAQVALNTIMADSLDFVSDEIEKLLKKKMPLNEACQKVIQGIMKEHGHVIFNGDGYADAWQKEAAKRGLPNLKTTADALPAMIAPEVVDVFEKYEVLTKDELHSRCEIYHEQYNQHIQTESALVVKVAKTIIMPSAVRYQGELAATAASLKAAGIKSITPALAEVTELVGNLDTALVALEKLMEKEDFKSIEEEAAYKTSKILPAMLAVREVADAMEGIVADDLWPLPSYQEILFIK
ncbi:glutamine synthetase III [Pseudodesulfovibrio sp. zrk46]|uniref:glutamine synthetase III family protein n=1 Tax=Pseudodesulfovibrio sp. zrk46 TaxID=2725288 RepID=UPI001449E681|nr:glutamine synthetase III [Pseudodesulfovibrio sp. zrk46]QJB55359.1 glutamine synthetase type III [Pseudodesulfovibrio sp. zrk46]